MKVSEIIEAAIGLTGGNQAELARRLGVSVASVNRWYSDKGVPDYASCLRLAKMLGRPAAEILTAAGHDPSLLPDNSESMSPEEAEIRARMKAREAIRVVKSLPEQHQDVAWEAALGVLNSFRIFAASPAVAPVAVAA